MIFRNAADRLQAALDDIESLKEQISSLTKAVLQLQGFLIERNFERSNDGNPE